MAGGGSHFVHLGWRPSQTVKDLTVARILGANAQTVAIANVVGNIGIAEATSLIDIFTAIRRGRRTLGANVIDLGPAPRAVVESVVIAGLISLAIAFFVLVFAAHVLFVAAVAMLVVFFILQIVGGIAGPVFAAMMEAIAIAMLIAVLARLDGTAMILGALVFIFIFGMCGSRPRQQHDGQQQT